jgi:exopolyphosphatase/guanosine-5'-triphosphate,3'-diphosphate pyrophosphatase
MGEPLVGVAPARDGLAGDDTYAAVDLGSNSFHLIVARWVDERLLVVDRLKERVALASAMHEGGQLNAEAMARALDCLGRFNQRLRALPSERVRAIGTNTFRRIDEPLAFVRRASGVLGHRIEIVSGHEEARLVYLGVRYDIGRGGERLLVIDIGGGSTELAYGGDRQPSVCESLKMGCVHWSEHYFPNGVISKGNFREAELAARRELEPVAAAVRQLQPDLTVGSSGSALAISRLLLANDWSDGSITIEGLQRLRAALIDAGHVERVMLDELTRGRRPVVAGGVAIMCGIFTALGLERIGTSFGALREGILVDMFDRAFADDPRETSVKRLMSQFAVDRAQGERVAMVARSLFEATRTAWGLDAEAGRFVEWGALLHEIGLAISHNDYHKHGAYLAMHADISGFSRDEQLVLAALIGNHRRKLREERLGRTVDEIERQLGMVLLLRIAVYLHRGRTAGNPPPLNPAAGPRTLRLGLTADWLLEHPLTAADLDGERSTWSSFGYQLIVV